MDDAAQMKERQEAGLAELADLGLALARDLQARALAADDKAACELSLAFHRIARSVRQTYALEARLEREARRAAREQEQEAAKARLARVQQRRAQVRRAVAPLIWTEAEGEDEAAEAWFVALEGVLTEASGEDDFLDAPIEACIERIREDLGLPPANAGPPEDGEPAAEPPDVVIWKSSG